MRESREDRLDREERREGNRGPFKSVNLGHVLLAVLGALYGGGEHAYNSGKYYEERGALIVVQQDMAAVKQQLTDMQKTLDRMQDEEGGRR